MTDEDGEPKPTAGASRPPNDPPVETFLSTVTCPRCRADLTIGFGFRILPTPGPEPPEPDDGPGPCQIHPGVDFNAAESSCPACAADEIADAEADMAEAEEERRNPEPPEEDGPPLEDPPEGEVPPEPEDDPPENDRKSGADPP